MLTQDRTHTSHARFFQKRKLLLLWLALFGALDPSFVIAQQGSPTLQIVSPPNGSIVTPGQSLTVDVSVTGTNAFTQVHVIGENIGISDPVKTPPFVFSLIIPNHLVGPKKLTAVGVIGPGNAAFSPSVIIDIEPTATITGLFVTPTQIQLGSPGQEFPLIASGTFDDGTTRDITRSANTMYHSDDQNIATVDPTGLVTGIGRSTTGAATRLLQTSILVQYGSRSVRVPVLVPTVGLDTIPPSTAAAALPGPNGNGWNKTNVTVNLSAVDNAGGTGVKEISFSLSGAQPGASVVAGSSTAVMISAEGITTLTYFSRDNAGNQEAPKTLMVRIDRTPPTISAVVNPPANANRWNKTNVTVSFTAGDGLSGVSSVTAPITVTTEGAGYVVTGTATDRAGNSASVNVSVNVDKTPPVIAGLPAPGCTLWPANHRLVQVGTVTATDGLSTLAPGSLQVRGTSNEPEDGLGDGDVAPDIVITGSTVQLRAERSGRGSGRVYIITATASDLAGNQATATATCTVPHDQRK
jgi:hypothetical protein